MISKIKSIKGTVARLLREVPETRDNDRLLLFKVWAIQNPDLRQPAYYLSDFALHFISGVYADPESIRRCRQKAQELHPELRGKSYVGRQGKSEPEMRGAMPSLDI